MGNYTRALALLAELESAIESEVIATEVASYFEDAQNDCARIRAALVRRVWDVRDALEKETR